MEQSRRDFFARTVKATLGLSMASADYPLNSRLAVKTEQKAKSIPTMNGQVSTGDLGVTLIAAAQVQRELNVPIWYPRHLSSGRAIRLARQEWRRFNEAVLLSYRSKVWLRWADPGADHRLLTVH